MANLFVALVSYLHRERHAAEAVNVLQPILVKLLIDNSVATRRVVEPMLVRNDADVRQATEEYERSKFELLFNRSGLEASKQVARARTFKVNPARLKNAPHKSGTIEPGWSSCAPAITRSQALIDGGHQ